LTVFTIGHSTRTLEELVRALRAWDVHALVDIRTIPRSRNNPQFNADALPGALAGTGLRYEPMPALGGRRGKKKGGASRNTGWQVDAFRNYADYAETAAFAQAIDRLVALAERETCAIMCAEAVWWRCHRRIVADYLLLRGVRVRHIFTEEKAEDATVTPFAHAEPDGTLSYRGEGER
jgi:uncharacterized protein (DUF488 family)